MFTQIQPHHLLSHPWVVFLASVISCVFRTAATCSSAGHNDSLVQLLALDLPSEEVPKKALTDKRVGYRAQSLDHMLLLRMVPFHCPFRTWLWHVPSQLCFRGSYLRNSPLQIQAMGPLLVSIKHIIMQRTLFDSLALVQANTQAISNARVGVKTHVNKNSLAAPCFDAVLIPPYTHPSPNYNL